MACSCCGFLDSADWDTSLSIARQLDAGGEAPIFGPPKRHSSRVITLTGETMTRLKEQWRPYDFQVIGVALYLKVGHQVEDHVHRIRHLDAREGRCEMGADAVVADAAAATSSRDVDG